MLTQLGWPSVLPFVVHGMVGIGIMTMGGLGPGGGGIGGDGGKNAAHAKCKAVGFLSVCMINNLASVLISSECF